MKKRKPDNRGKTASLTKRKQSEALQYLGILEARSNNPAAAAAFFAQAASLDPGNPELLNNLGYFCQQSGQPTKAIECYEKSLKLKPNAVLTLCNLGLLHKHLGNNDQAMTCFHQAIAASPDDIAALCNRANLHLECGDVNAALADFDKALALAPDNPTIINGRASVLSELSRYEDAIDCISSAIARKPDYVQAWSNQGDAYYNLGKSTQAIECYEQALRLAPNHTKTLANLASVFISDPSYADRAMTQSDESFTAYLNSEFSDNGPAISRIRYSGVSAFRLAHDLGQAKYIVQNFADDQVQGIRDFIDVAERVLAHNREHSAQHESASVQVAEADIDTILCYMRTPWRPPAPVIAHCLNPDNDWKRLEEQYLDGHPEILVIDNFLAPAALTAFQQYCLAAKVWIREYPNRYLGAFANQGFVSPLHLQLAREFRVNMPRVFKLYPLNQLWAFKYDSSSGNGINIHADFALVNLNFWITPDRFNLDPNSGGLKVYEHPAPETWTFHDYNTNSQAMYDYLAQNNSRCQSIAYRCNRAVLFNSALFHETDTIRFAHGYESRRINMTYLFGKQLA